MQPSGFVVEDKAGGFVAWSPCILAARAALRENAHAERVFRCEDGALVSMRPRAQKPAADP